jgi:hypothetical protein
VQLKGKRVIETPNDVIEGPVSNFTTLDGALENWGKLNERRFVWGEIVTVLAKLETKLGSVVDFHIPASASYVGVHFSHNPKVIGAYINVGHIDHHDFVEGSVWKEARRYHRSLLSTSQGEGSGGKKKDDEMRIACPTCGIQLPLVGGCDTCG